MRLDVQVIRQSIDNLLLQHPELAEDDVLRADMIEGETQAHEFLTQIVRRIENAKGLAAGTSERLAELKARKDRFERREEALRQLAFKVMDAASLPKIELPEATLSLRTGQPALVGETAPEQLPDELCKIKREANRTKIKEELKAGRTVPGFSLSNPAPYLTIRIK